MILFFLFVGSFFPQIKGVLRDAYTVFPYTEKYWNTGLYLRSINCNCSTITTQELEAAVSIFASSTLPGGYYNIYYYVDKSYLQPKFIGFEKIKEDLKNGVKVAGLWELPDWIFGGTYYEGRHARLLLESEFQSETAKRIITDYKVDYYIHDKNQRPSNLYNSLFKKMDKVYDNPLTNVHSLQKGLS